MLFFLGGVMALHKEATAQGMNNERLEEILYEISHGVNGQTGYWEVKYYDRYLLVITDESHNRMRIISPIIEESKLTRKELTASLSANFDKALDVKYALSNEYMWCIFVHPLNELTGDQFLDAMNQVYFGSRNFGTSYVSTDIVFGTAGEESEEKK